MLTEQEATDTGLLLYPQHFEPITNFRGKCIISARQFNRDTLEYFHSQADRTANQLNSSSASYVLREKLSSKKMAVLFYEASTRTRSMVEFAAMSLGVGVFTETDVTMSSRLKGESLGHTYRVLTGPHGADLVVVRDPQAGFFEEIYPYHKLTQVPVINGGDGDREHPMQMLKDYRIWRKDLGSLDGKRFTFVGDLKGSRTIHSDLYMLSLHQGVEVVLVAPERQQATSEMRKMLADAGVKVLPFRDFDEMRENGEEPGDAVNVVRPQMERLKIDGEEPVGGLVTHLKAAFARLRITPEWVKQYPGTNIYHPLPIKRVEQVERNGQTEWMKVPGEISEEIDFMEQNRYFAQSDEGIYVTATALGLVLAA